MGTNSNVRIDFPSRVEFCYPSIQDINVQFMYMQSSILQGQNKTHISQPLVLYGWKLKKAAWLILSHWIELSIFLLVAALIIKRWDMWHKESIQSLVITLLDIHDSVMINRAPLLSVDGWATTCMIFLFENYHIVRMLQIFSNSGFLEILLGKCHETFDFNKYK